MTERSLAKCPDGFMFFKVSNDEEKKALFPKRCNDRINCKICAKEFSDRKRYKDKSLIKSLIIAKGRADFLTGELTIPKNTSAYLESDSTKRKPFMGAARKTIQQFTEKAGVLMVYQNWGETPPIEPHWHIHFLVFPFMPDKSKGISFIPREKLVSAWKKELVDAGVLSKKDVKEIKVVNLQAIKANDDKYLIKLYHRINYMVRQPIEDLARVHSETDQETLLSIADQMGKNFHRFVWFGWLSPACRGKALKAIGIELRKFKSEDEWELVGYGDIIRDDEGSFFFFKATVDKLGFWHRGNKFAQIKLDPETANNALRKRMPYEMYHFTGNNS